MMMAVAKQKPPIRLRKEVQLLLEHQLQRLRDQQGLVKKPVDICEAALLDFFKLSSVEQKARIYGHDQAVDELTRAMDVAASAAAQGLRRGRQERGGSGGTTGR